MTLEEVEQKGSSIIARYCSRRVVNFRDCSPGKELPKGLIAWEVELGEYGRIEVTPNFVGCPV